MESITVIFSKSIHPVSFLIRLFTWSKWSHCGVLMPDGEGVIEARGGEGVVCTRLQDFKKRNKHYTIVSIPVKSRREAFKRLRDQVGKGYDMTAIYSILFRRNWQVTDAWFCSELIAYSTGLFRKDYIKRVTPEMLWRISED